MFKAIKLTLNMFRPLIIKWVEICRYTNVQIIVINTFLKALILYDSMGF